ncbi:hypothetical protein Y88_2359 [Novosphingobium nitrogenifigens DSM 19370]|uniref:Uncharacterized protein n=1 Tax=Novosphingobium nitrogenifigens DSM 19370 TaxID=983920 RepID=F1Z6D7_9SPHN|nr:biotin/lipoyl-binding protein [Novosphingobium nitrogenifigens]EGD59919.1 hypothetical protein Y88_2359 [Novosphingobium nitrogenifigens DSM 19370]
MASRLQTVLVPVAALALVGGGAAWWRTQSHETLPAGIIGSNGRIELKRTDVAVKYPGRLVALRVDEGDEVHAGDVIAEEDPADTLAQLKGAQASRERAMAAQDRASGETGARESQAGLAAIDLHQTEKLAAQHMISPVELDQRRLAYAGATAGVAAAHGGVAEAHGAIAEADAAIDRLKTVLADLRIVAPGKPGTRYTVEYRVVENGAVLPSGGRIVSLLNPDDVSLTLFLPAATVARLAVGDEARVLPEGMGRAVPARITFIAPDAQFTPKFVETASEREKLTYRVKLTVTPEGIRALGGKLKAGMTADGYVRTDTHVAWPDFGGKTNGN